MKKLSLILLLGTIYLGVQAQADEIVATWITAEKTSHVRIFKATNGKYYGKLDKVETEGKKDENNPDESKRDQLLLGQQILKGFSYDSEKKQWTGGTIYDPDNGKTYDCYMWFEDNMDMLIIKGYVMGMKFVGRSTEWEKLK